MRVIPSRRSAPPARVNAGDCGCGGGKSTGGSRAGSQFSYGVLERPRYYARQLMTPDDLLLEADYFRDKLRRHNMFLHGWGVVCGALVCVVPRREPARGSALNERQTSRLRANDARSQYQSGNGKENGNGAGGNEPWLVRVEPGYILGPYGDEIIIDKPIEVPLRGHGVSGCGADSSDDLADPWCSEVYVDHREGPFYIAVRYEECQVRPVRGQPSGCGCDEEPCEYSRFRDGFRIGILDCCPVDQDRENAPKDGAWDPPFDRHCPACPISPWVVLAAVKIADDGRVTDIDNCSCRRIMVTTRDQWTTCTGTNCDHHEGEETVEVNEAAGAAGVSPGDDAAGTGLTGPAEAAPAEEARGKPKRR